MPDARTASVRPARRTELLDALEELVAAAAAGEPLSGPAGARLDGQARRWSTSVGSPAEVVALVAEARATRRATRRREEALQRVTLVAVDAVAQRQVREALTDPLTGLATRARMEDDVQHLLAMSLRAGSPLTAVILDVDGLKQINDEQGHAAGDAALAGVGSAIREHLRLTDRAFRWGGDEFVILMPGTDAEGAQRVVERIQASCGTPTSAGVAMHTDGANAVDVATWLSMADADLYRRRGAARAALAPLPVVRRRRTSAPALLALATLAAATVGWVGASTVAQTLGLGSGRHAATTSAPAVVTAPGTSGGGGVSVPHARPVAPVTRTVTVTRVVSRPAPKPAQEPAVAPPVRVPVRVPVVDVPVTPPVVPDPVTVPDVQPTSVVSSVLGTVHGLLDRLL